MSSLLIAKKDFQDAIRSRTLFAVVALFTAVVAGMIYYTLTMVSPAEPAELTDLHGYMANFVAVVGTLLGYNAIVGERESGSLQFLLGQPHTRRDVVVGKLLGRAAVVTVTVLVAFAVVAAHYAVLADAPSFTNYARFAGKMMVLGVVFVAISVAFSALVRSTTVALWGAIGLAILFAFVWDSVLSVINTLLINSDSTPNWYDLITRLNPKHAFMNVREPSTFYLEPWFGVVILGGWILVPLGLAYLRFERGDLA